MFWSAARHILIASPHRITSIPHRLGRELPVAESRGDKFFAVFDQTDRTLITDEELERYFNGDESAACFKPDRQTEATAHDLQAGFGVHVPWHGAALGAQRRQVSIAVSCNFDLASFSG